MKQVKKTHQNENFYFTIIYYIKNYQKLPKPTDLGITKQARNYYVRQLKINGFIRKKGYGTWEILKEMKDIKEVKKIKKDTPCKSKGCEKVFTSKKNIRGHGFIITWIIPKIRNWRNRERFLDKKDIKYKPIPQGQRLIIRNHKVWLCKKSIVIYTPKGLSYYSESAKYSKKYALYDHEQILIYLENLFKISFKINNMYGFRTSRHHYARIKDELAKRYREEGKVLKISDEKGVWWIGDKSFTDEGEAIRKDTAIADMDDVVNPFMNDLKHHYEDTGETITISKMLKLNQAIVRNQVIFDKNMMSHIEAVKNLNKAVNELRKEIGKR